MDYNPNIHHRRSIRLRGYDYSQSGLYFITICTKNRECLFGHIANGKMHLNDAGKMVERWYYEMGNKYPDKRCHEMVVMPNHFHCIIENIETNVVGDAHVGAPLRGRPIMDERGYFITDERGHPITNERGCPAMDERDHPTTNECGRPTTNQREHSILDECDANIDQQSGKYGMHNIKFGATIGDAMDWFKTMTTNEYIRGVKTLGWKPFDQKLWQRNYYEHIVRDEQSYQRIAIYIENNPDKWTDDKFYGTGLDVNAKQRL